MTYFTAGIENLHGALPVDDVRSDDTDETCPNGSTSDCDAVIF